MKLRKLRTALAVARTGSVVSAARMLGLSQPAVTRALQSLEREIGTKLFQRASRSLVCTEAGERLTARLARAQEQLRLAETELPGSSDRLANQLTIQAADHEFAALVGIADAGTISAAARRSGLSQPALNRSLRALENRLDLALYYRTPAGMRLTPAGEILLRRSKLAMSEIRQAMEELAALKGEPGGSIRIGALPMTRVRLVPLAVERLLQKYPMAEIAIIDGTYEALATALRFGDIDVLVGTIRQPQRDGLASEELFRDDIAIVASARHPLADRRSLELRDCVGYGWVLPFKTVPLRLDFEKMLDKAGLQRPQQVIEADSMIAVRTFLIQGDRLALLSRHQVHHEVSWGFLKVLPLHLESALRPVGLTVRDDYQPTSLMRALLDELRAVGADMHNETQANMQHPRTAAKTVKQRN